ncbi:type II toxin-antitoxin system VapC family toxin [Parasediminibacterium sp. JCM 36343]|uniref:type II toxin-antitoxin system VapC family toxin n=1 Tax=Parasediminibacterium sp. JCM 36343 TaxID=3374279 RepID=UPI00397A09CA
MAKCSLDNLLKSNQPVISAITEIELLCWKSATEKDVELLHSFMNNSLVIELEKAIKLKTAEVRKANRIKLPDAIIAATAIVYDLTLLSRNTSDFKNIENIKMVNPWKIV